MNFRELTRIFTVNQMEQILQRVQRAVDGEEGEDRDAALALALARDMGIGDVERDELLLEMRDILVDEILKRRMA